MAKRAVVIGINNYQDQEKIRPLKGAENDAREICDSLKNYGGFDILHFLTADNATFANIRQAISDLFWRTDDCEMAVFYFSGHGFQDGYGQGYIAPYDIKYAEPFVRGIRTQELKEFFLASKGKQSALLILDACHSGVATEGRKGLVNLTPLSKSLEPSDEETPTRGSGRFILASSRADQESREINCWHKIRGENESEHFHGAFTFHLLEGLNGQAAGSDNQVTLGRLHTYLKDQTKDMKEQERTFWGFGSGPVEDRVLVEACRLRDIVRQFQDAGECLKDSSVSALFKAVKFLDLAVRGFPEAKEAIPLKEEIDKRLIQCGKAINSWRAQNPDQRMELARFREFLLLENLAQKLCFELVAKQSPARRNLLLELVQVSTGDFSAGDSGISVLMGDLSIAESSLGSAAPARGGKL